MAARRLDWDDLRYFLAVAESGSFTKAAEDLRADQTTIGRRIRELEDSLGTKLFDRHSKGMKLTPSGMAIVDDASAMNQIAVNIERRLAGLDQEMDGRVRISVTEGLGSYWLIPQLVEFQQAFPRLTFEILTENKHADLANREADLAIRFERPKDPKLRVRKVGVMRFALFASESYLRLFGTPKERSELRRHRLVDLTAYQDSRVMQDWQAITRDHPRIVVRANTSTPFYHAVKSGYGIGLFPRYNRIITPELVQLPIDIGGQLEIWLVSHEETGRNARTREMLNELTKLFQRDRAEWFS